MGLGIDTIVGSAVNPGSGGASVTMNSGDSATIRNFNPPAKAFIHWLSRQGTVAGLVGIKSPRFHDVSRGLQWIFNESPATQLLPPQVGQPVYGADATTISVGGGTSETDGCAIGIYYQDIPGISAQLYSLGDVLPLIVNLKPVEVDCTQSGTAFNWADTVLTTTENLLKANTYYAVLGYTTDTAALAVGLKSPETGNLRLCGPGPTTTFFTDQFFIYMSQQHQSPYIPVFNANNRAGIFVSLACLATSGTTKVQLNLAELAGFTPSIH